MKKCVHGKREACCIECGGSQVLAPPVLRAPFLSHTLLLPSAHAQQTLSRSASTSDSSTSA
eukprot:476378-Rhodomonas_salina.1